MQLSKLWRNECALLADKYSTDGEVLSVANGILHRLGLLEVTRSSSATPVNEGATLTFNAPPTGATQVPAELTLNTVSPLAPVIEPVASPEVSAIAPPKPPSPASAAKKAPAVPQPPRRPVMAAAAKPTASKQSSSHTKQILTAVGTLVLVVAIWGVLRRKPAPPAAQEPSAEAPSAVATPAAPPVEPQLPMLRVSSDAGAGKVTLDDQPASELQDGQWSLDKISAGDHKFSVEGARGQTSFTFSAAAGAAPLVSGPIVAKGVVAVVVTGGADHVRVYASDSSAKVSLDGQPPVDVSKEGVELPGISTGNHELAVTRGHDQYKLGFDVGSAPTLSAFLESGQSESLGTLLVVAGQDKAKVFLNGKPQPQLTQNGQLRIPNLELKDYAVRVSKNGFQDLPEQKIRIRKGEQGKVIFNLQPIPHLASLTIQGGAPGSAILIDQTSVGIVQPDGTLTVSTVSPGDHVVEIRKDRFKTKQIKKHFVVGTAVSLTAADVALEAAPGELKISFTPADAQVTLTKAGEAPIKVNNGATLSLPGGSYTLTAKTADNFTRTSTVEMTAGQSKTLDLALAPSGMSKWEDTSGWKQEKDSFVRKGGDFVMYSLSPTSGTFVFSAMLAKGHRLQWLLNCTDANNYVLFQMDDNNFYRTVVRNGQRGDETKIPHKNEKKSFRTIQIRVGPNEIVHSDPAGGELGSA